MNKRVVIGFSSILVLILASVFVSAETPVDSLKSVGQGIFDLLKPLTETLLGTTPASDLLFAKVLFLIILFSIVFAVLDQIEFFSEKSWVLFLVSAAVAILGIRYLGESDWINTIILPYSVLGIAITAGLPFVIYFIMVDFGLKAAKNGPIRRFAWIFFAVIFIGLWFSRYNSIKNAGWIYPATALAAFLMFLFDGTMNAWIRGLEVQKVGAKNAETALTEVKKKIADLPTLESQGIISPSEAKKRLKEYKKMAARLMKY